MELSRRELLKLLGVSGTAAAGGIWAADSVLSLPDRIFERTLAGPRIETWKNSICSQCPGACGIRVRCIDDIPVRVQGNPLHPVNRGAACPVAEAGIEILFQPKRLRQPLKRSGERGDGQWEPLSWGQALGVLTERLGRLRDEKTPEKLVLLTRTHEELSDQLCRRFMQAFGSPNYFTRSDARMLSLPTQLTQRTERVPFYDLANTQLLLNFGADLLDQGLSPIQCNQWYAAIRQKPGNRIVHIGSLLSRTAANASEWVSIRPGTMAAMALSIAYVLIQDGTYDSEFIGRKTLGFSDWEDEAGNPHKGFKTLVLEAYYPERAAQVCGVPPHKIVEIARAFGAANPAVAIAGPEAALATNGLYTAWAVYCLNALKGSFQKKGGVAFPETLELPWSPFQPDATAREGLGTARMGRGTPPSPWILHDPDQLLFTPASSGIDTLIVHQADPLFESVHANEWKTLFKRIPFMVHCTSFLSETSADADLILPEPMFLERWGAGLNHPGVEFAHFGVQHPVIEPLYDTRQLEDILLHVGSELEGVTEALPWKDYASCIKESARSIFSSGVGTIFSESVSPSWIEFLRERGWRSYDYSTFDEFWELLLEKGGWWDPLSAQHLTREDSSRADRKFDFNSQVFDRNLEMPRFHGESIDFPYHLLTFQLLAGACGAGMQADLLYEFFGLHSRRYWRSWVEINPETARKLDIREDEEVRIISPRGEITARAKIEPTVMPEVVALPFGLGHQVPGEHENPIGVNPYHILVADRDEMCGLPSLISTRVRLEKT